MKVKTSLILLCAICLAAVVANAQDANPETVELMSQGSALYLQRDFKAAAITYQKALNLEKARPTLNKTMWRVLVDQLGMAYGISGDLKKAKETFDYGLEKDPKYPMFHYNMACTYGEMNDPEKAIVYLRQAFENKANMIKGEKLPNPFTDSSFSEIHEQRQICQRAHRDYESIV